MTKIIQKLVTHGWLLNSKWLDNVHHAKPLRNLQYLIIKYWTNENTNSKHYLNTTACSTQLTWRDKLGFENPLFREHVLEISSTPSWGKHGWSTKNCVLHVGNKTLCPWKHSLLTKGYKGYHLDSKWIQNVADVQHVVLRPCVLQEPKSQTLTSWPFSVFICFENWAG